MLLRFGLQVRWVSADDARLARDVTDRSWPTRLAASEAFERWWAKYGDHLPECRRPQAPVPVLVDARCVIVGVLAATALRSDGPLEVTRANHYEA